MSLQDFHWVGNKSFNVYAFPNFSIHRDSSILQIISIFSTVLVTYIASLMTYLNWSIDPMSHEKLWRKLLTYPYYHLKVFLFTRERKTSCIPLQESLTNEKKILVLVTESSHFRTCATFSTTLRKFSRFSSPLNFSVNKGTERCTMTLITDFESLFVAPSILCSPPCSLAND